MAPKFEVISGGMDSNRPSAPTTQASTNESAPIRATRGNPRELLEYAKLLRQDLASLPSKSDDECSAIFKKIEGDWASIYDGPHGPFVLYKDLKEHNGKLVRNRLTEILTTKIERLERDAQSIIESTKEIR